MHNLKFAGTPKVKDSYLSSISLQENFAFSEEFKFGQKFLTLDNGYATVGFSGEKNIVKKTTIRAVFLSFINFLSRCNDTNFRKNIYIYHCK